MNTVPYNLPSSAGEGGYMLFPDYRRNIQRAYVMNSSGIFSNATGFFMMYFTLR